MKRIAALYTCHNRKVKTLASLSTLYKAKLKSTNDFQLTIYLTDDGSTDGTSKAVKEQFPNVTIIAGSGDLFWSEGMRVSWKKALENNYDAYLLLNDDVEIYDSVFDQLFEAHKYCLNQFNKPGIYIGATENKNTGELTYSGSLVLNKFLYTQRRLAPNGNFQSCDLANANIMLVTREVVEQIGIFPEGYSHGISDYHYSLTASINNIPVLVAKAYCGHCLFDHAYIYADFATKSFDERKKILNNPTGLALDSYKKYMRRFFPFRYPFVAFFGWFKLYFPKIYVSYFTRR